MPIPRIYQPLPLQTACLLRLTEKASHHLARVLRMQKGDAIAIFNGQGGEYSAVITQIDKKGVEVEMLAFTAREAESPLAIELGQGIARGEKMDFIVQKAVELGVKSITPLVTARCNVKLNNDREEKRIQHWQTVAISACEQSGRNQIPKISPLLSLEEWLASTNADLRFVLSPHVKMSLSPAETIHPQTRIALLIGPEGGLSDKEVAMAVDHGFAPLQLGPRILRTETAALVALSVLQTYYGDLTT